MLTLRRAVKTITGTGLELFRRDLVHQIDTGSHSGQSIRLKNWILQARLERARLRGDRGAIEKALFAYWKGDTADYFYDRFKTRFKDWFLGPHQVIVDALVTEAAQEPFARVVEVGCGDGRVLQHCAGRLPQIPDFLGIDINPTIIERNCVTYAGLPRLRFASGDASALLPPEFADGTVLMTYGGVMEYFAPDELARLFRLLCGYRRTAVVLVEPVDPAHDLTAERGSHVFGAENSFSHNHRALLEDAGFRIVFAQEMDLGQVRWMLMLGVSEYR